MKKSSLSIRVKKIKSFDKATAEQAVAWIFLGNLRIAEVEKADDFGDFCICYALCFDQKAHWDRYCIDGVKGFDRSIKKCVSFAKKIRCAFLKNII
jgi:hypothetical protein